MDKRDKRSIYLRAEAYATGQINNGGHARFEHGALATGWRAGYRAALHDMRRCIANGWDTASKFEEVTKFLAPRR